MRRLRDRRHRSEEHEEHISESWLLPYADILTLLLALFIVLFASSAIDSEKYQAIMEAFQSEFTGISNPSNPTKPEVSGEIPTIPSPSEEEEQTEELDELKIKIQNYIESNNLQEVVSLGDTRRGIEVTFKDVILFDSGRAGLKPGSYTTLDSLIGLLKSVPNNISIEGHTDNVPIGDAPFRSNWELSSARALSVLEYFEAQGIKKDRLGFTGYGEYQPLTANDTDEHRQENRRVNIVILRDNQGIE